MEAQLFGLKTIREQDCGQCLKINDSVTAAVVVVVFGIDVASVTVTIVCAIVASAIGLVFCVLLLMS